MKKITLVILVTLFSFSSLANVQKVEVKSPLTSKLLIQFKKNLSKKEMSKLKEHIMALKGKSVPALILVMKNAHYPDKNKWMATFLLGKIMGKKSAPFIAKFSKHPNWVMRMASLKTLLALKQNTYTDVYLDLLKDRSMIVRYQALDTINKLNITELAPNVWSMLYDKKNYHYNKLSPKLKKRAHIIKAVIKTVGDLKFKKAETALLSMYQKKKYADIYEEIDYSLQLITGKKSPKDDFRQKKRFWNKYMISQTIIR